MNDILLDKPIRPLIMAIMDEVMEINGNGGKAHRLEYDPTEIPIEVLIPLAKLLTVEAGSHGHRNWEKLTVQEHMKHLYVHFLEFESSALDPAHNVEKLDYELLRVVARAMFAYATFMQNVKCKEC